MPGGAPGRLRPIDILVLCTGNICRSPMAEAFLRQRLSELGVPARVSSAGLLDSGAPASSEGVQALVAYGLDTSAHRSRRMTADMLRAADLVLCMAREHVREAVLLHPPCWPRTFTLKELVRRARQVGPRRPGEELQDWLAKVHAGRNRAELLGASGDDDVADPIGRSRSVYERTAEELQGFVDQLVELGWRGAVREEEMRR